MAYATPADVARVATRGWDDIAQRFTAFNVKTETRVLGRRIHDQLGIITRFVAGRQGTLAPV